MNAPKGFSAYEVKHSFDYAHCIQENDKIFQMLDRIYNICLPNQECHKFVSAFGDIKVGDYIIYKGDPLMHHCKKEVFENRHILH